MLNIETTDPEVEVEAEGEGDKNNSEEESVPHRYDNEKNDIMKRIK
jgi:hypothetical protein